MLKEKFLAEYGLSQNGLAKAIGILPNQITEIVNNRRRISADTALRLGLKPAIVARIKSRRAA
jgi:antitoxin HigA-1